MVTSAVLDELEYGLPSPLAKRNELSIKNGGTKTLQYLSTINPNGLVPAIVHDGVPIWESSAITMYLGETFGVERKQPLYPKLSPKRGEAMKWIVWANTILAEAGGRLYNAQSKGSPGSVGQGSQDSAQKEETRSAEETKAVQDIGVCLDVLNGALHENHFLLGADYTLADTHVWSFLSYLVILGVSLDKHTNVKAWITKVGDRPALKPK